MSVVLDTNIFLHAIDGSDASKEMIATPLVAQGIRNRLIVPRQVVGELLSVGHRRGSTLLDNARRTTLLLERVATIVDTTSAATHVASDLAARYQLQYFDALICTVARAAGATVLVSEDMHDGLKLGELTILDPFVEANRDKVAALLAG